MCGEYRDGADTHCFIGLKLPSTTNLKHNVYPCAHLFTHRQIAHDPYPYSRN
jgi:hypothetical protein